MPRRAAYKIQKTSKGWQVNIPAKHSATGGRQRRYFETQAEATGFVQTLGIQIENFGLFAQVLKPGESEQAKAALRLLEDAGLQVGLLQAVKAFVASEAKRKQSRPLAEVIDAFLAYRKRSEKYALSLQRTRARLEPLHAVLIADIAAEQIEALLTNTADTYRNALLREIRAVFAYGVKRGWCAENPVARMDFARVKVGEREIYSVAEAAALLRSADEHHPALLPFVAIGLFAGVRVYELMRLEWQAVDLAESSIDLPAAITKRGRRRSIPMEPALRAWLERHVAQHGIRQGFVLGPRTYNTLRPQLRALFKDAGVRWRQNAARHSFASYWLAEHGDLTALALRLGHVGGMEVLHQYYHRTVKKAEAARFWTLTPAPASRKVISLRNA